MLPSRFTVFVAAKVPSPSYKVVIAKPVFNCANVYWLFVPATESYPTISVFAVVAPVVNAENFTPAILFIL